jgi:uncharacterized phiE125 gp8 family phage protein
MSGTLYLITPPTDDVVSVTDARAQLRLSSDVTDAMIEALIDAAVAQLDPAGGGWLGRALRPQTWELRLSRFPYGYCGTGYARNFRPDVGIELPYPPLLTVDSVKYDDGNGTELTLIEGTGFRVLGGGTRKSCVLPVYNGNWPSSVRCDAESVRVRFTSGYELGTVDEMPAPIKQAVMLMAKHLNGLAERNLFVSSEDVAGLGSRSFVVSENAALVMKAAAEGLLSTYRVYD